ncbi:TPR-like protein [Auriscalpium vulgare]|uniref:TPR-like protein n=1 Tax=Auriscalpium vulgare TaxID=40419 RepID=A0ACB8S1Y4_9AGAM|nr:TPR-like protein [Auriscalpium vulgare]
MAWSDEEEDFDSEQSEDDEYSDDVSEDEDPSEDDADPSGAALPNAEVQIEGDFNRLVQDIRLADDASTTGVLGKEWDLNIDDQENAFRDDLRLASGIGRKRAAKHPASHRAEQKGHRAGIVLSPQVRALLGDGNQAYVDGDIQASIRLMQEVIRIEPRASSAWSVLANCYQDLAQPQKALQLRIMGAHLHHDAEEWDRLARESREQGYNQQALYCYGKVYSLDRANFSALWDRAALARQMGDHKTARNSLLAILKSVPYDLTVLEELRPILIELGDLALCAALFDAAFAHYVGAYPAGHGVDATSGAEVPGGGFALMELLVLADLYNSLGEHERAVHALRRGCRWLQGRAEQKFWDACEDDREYDVGDARAQPAGPREVPPGRFPLDVNARHRLAVARIKMRDVEEGKMHAGIVLAQDVADYAPLFVEIADAYYERDMYAEARPIYELLGQDASTSSVYILLQVAKCCHMMGSLHEAAEVYESVIATDPSLKDAKMRLAGIYEVLGELRKAMALVDSVIDLRKRRGRGAEDDGPQSTEPASTSLFEEGSTAKKKGKGKARDRLSLAQLMELEKKKEEEVKRGYKRVQELWPRMMLPAGADGQAAAEREWMLEAELLVETFRETRMLFLTTRNNPFRGMFPRRPRHKETEETEETEDAMASRLALDMERDRVANRLKKDSGAQEAVDVFRGIHFDEWLRLFMQYSFLLTKNGQYDLAEEVLTHIMHSNAFGKHREKIDCIRLSLIACAIYAKRHMVVVEQCRKFISVYQFNNDPMRLLSASLASGFRSTDAFIHSTLQKHLLREVKIADIALKSKDKVKWARTRWTMTAGAAAKSTDGDDAADEDPVGGAEEKGPIPLPTKDNPVFVAMYGQICMAAKSYQSALFYLLHAYDYCPHDPMVCLSLAIASMGRAMQRQADNRHNLIAQAMAFLTQYRELRQGDPQGLDEVEFNFGRAFQQLGLHSLAVKHYERVLELTEARLKTSPDDFGLAREAAYNLSLIFVTTGATSLAEGLYRRWLSL